MVLLLLLLLLFVLAKVYHELIHQKFFSRSW